MMGEADIITEMEEEEEETTPIRNEVTSLAIVSSNKDGILRELVGEEEQQAAVGLRLVPRCLRYNNGPPEATGLAIDIFARATVVMSSIFLGPALLTLSYEAAGCVDDEEQTCDNRVYGMKPSSLLTNIAIANGLIVAFTMPFFGACVDHTSHRKRVAWISAIFLTVLKGIEISISAKTWFVISILQVLAGVLFNTHIIATYAYTAELSNDHTVQTKYNTFFFVVMYIATLLFMGTVLAISFPLDLDDVETARVSQTVTTVTCSILFPFVWRFLFRNRPALSQVPEGQSLLTAGFRKIIKTAGMIHRDMPALKNLMLALIFSEAATSALVTVATTYMSHYLKMDGNEIGAVFLIVLLTGIPGSKLGEYLALKFNPLISAKFFYLLFIVVTSLAALVLSGPERARFVSVFAVGWGIGLGGIPIQHVTLFVTAIPRGQETELMGSYIFCGNVLSWLPPLVFTILNESGFSMTFGLASLSLFFLIGFIFLTLIGKYEAALRRAQDMSNQEPPLHINLAANQGDLL